MSYNFRLKEFGNGTFQLSYFSRDMFNDTSRKSAAIAPEIWPDDFSYMIDVDPFELPEVYFNEDYLQDDEDLKPQVDRDRSLASSLSRTKKMIFDYGRSNVWEWFFTLTFAPDKCPDLERYDYSLCCSRVRKWFKHMKERYCPDMKYLIVAEKHKSGAWHFHALVSNCSELEIVEAENRKRLIGYKTVKIKRKKEEVPVYDVMRTRYPDGHIIYNVSNWSFGFSTATKISDTRRVVSYISKYITKDLADITFGKQRYFVSKNCDVPKIKVGYIADASQLDKLISHIEYTRNVKLSTFQKTYSIEVGDYFNAVSIFEFGADEKGILDPWSEDDFKKYDRYVSTMWLRGTKN